MENEKNYKLVNFSPLLNFMKSPFVLYHYTLLNPKPMVFFLRDPLKSKFWTGHAQLYREVLEVEML